VNDVIVLCVLGTAILGFFVSLIRRSIIHTSPGLFSQYFSKYGDDFDESEKLYRIDVLLTFSSLVIRAAFAGFLLLWREQSGSWYLPDKGPEETLEPALLLVLVEMLFYGMLMFELLPQVIATWAGERIGAATIPFLDHAERLGAPLTRSFRAARRVLLRAVGHDDGNHEADLATKGIRAAVEIGEREGIRPTR